MRRACGAIATAAVLMAGGLAPEAMAGPTWLAPNDLSAPGQDAGGPQVAVDGQGNATAIWYRPK